VSGCHPVPVIVPASSRGRQARAGGHRPRDMPHPQHLGRVATGKPSMGIAQAGIAGAAASDGRSAHTVTGPGSGGRLANHLDQVTTAHPPGHQTAVAISASSTDAEPEQGVLARERSVIVMAEATVAGGGLVRRPWVLLWALGLAQLMVVLDRS